MATTEESRPEQAPCHLVPVTQGHWVGRNLEASTVFPGLEMGLVCKSTSLSPSDSLRKDLILDEKRKNRCIFLLSDCKERLVFARMNAQTAILLVCGLSLVRSPAVAQKPISVRQQLTPFRLPFNTGMREASAAPKTGSVGGHRGQMPGHSDDMSLLTSSLLSLFLQGLAGEACRGAGMFNSRMRGALEVGLSTQLGRRALHPVKNNTMKIL